MAPERAPALPGATLGVLGGGQLGRMFALEAKRMGYRIAVLDPEPDSPCAQVADIVIEGEYADADALRRLAEACDVLTYEFENVDVRAVEALEAMGKPVFPGSVALRVCQDRILEKDFARSRGIPVTRYAPIRSESDAERAWQEVGFPSFLKTARGGYDGKGQVRLESPEEGRRAWREFGGRDLILEAVAPFLREISVVARRGRDGSFAAYPPAENTHVRNVLDVSVFPARAAEATARQAREIAREVAEGLDLVGVFCVELFELADGSLLLNEIAPRPHNSGHATLDACLCSQFEQQVRAICGLPAGGTEPLRAAAMVNVLGTGEGDTLRGLEGLLRQPDVAWHWYGKKRAPRGRKMGHFTVLADTPDQAEARAVALRPLLRWENGSDPRFSSP